MDCIVSVIILTRNRKEQVLRAIESVLQVKDYEEQTEIIVVDNNDDDDTACEITKQFPSVRIIKMYGNKGVTIPRNIAAKESTGKYLYFMDDDSWVSSGVFPPCIEALEEDNRVFLAASRVRFARADGTLLTPIREYPEFYLTVLPNESNIMVRKETFIALGGFNELLFFGSEGGDLGLRAFYRDYYCVVATKSIAFHPTIATKRITTYHKHELLKATCISTMMTWPFFFRAIRVIRHIFLVATDLLIAQHDGWGAIDALRIGLNLLFSSYQRDQEIRLKKWIAYRKLVGKIVEVRPGTVQDYFEG